jgi:hypothetical protein
MTNYETNVVAWAQEQAALLRAGKFAELDIEHFADEIESVGRAEICGFEERMAVLLAHLLAWQALPQERTADLRDRIATRRQSVARLLRGTPSLSDSLTDPHFWRRAWQDAILASVADAEARRHGLPQVCPWASPRDIPMICPWAASDVMDTAFLPD